MRVACIIMQKDEGNLLRLWLLYHGTIFGFNNLYVFDNGSEDKDTIAILSEFAKRGVHIEYKYDTAADFEKKGDIIGALIKQLSRDAPYDIYQPLDTDEFVGAHDKAVGLKVDRDAIFAEFARHVDATDVPHIHGSYFNIPDSRLFYFLGEQKCFFGRSNFGHLDIGFHWGKSSDPNGKPYKTNITHVHFQNKPFALLRTHAANKLRARVPSLSREVLETYKGPGFHLAKYFLIEEAEYYAQFKKMTATAVELPAFSEFILSFGHGNPYARAAAEQALASAASERPPQENVNEAKPL